MLFLPEVPAACPYFGSAPYLLSDADRSYALLDRDTLRQVPRLIHVAASADGYVVGE